MKASSFIMTTLIAAAAMTSTAWAETSAETITVDASYDDGTDGYGETKFSNLSSAFDIAGSVSGANEIKVVGFVTSGEIKGEGYGDILVSGSDNAVVDFRSTAFYVEGGSNITFDKSVALDNVSQIIAQGTNSHITISGSATVENSAFVVCDYNKASNITVTKTGKLHITGESGDGLLAVRGGFVKVTGTVVDSKTTTNEASLIFGWGKIGESSWWTNDNNNILDIKDAVVTGANLEIGNGTHQGELRADNSVVNLCHLVLTGKTSYANYGQWVELDDSVMNVAGGITIGKEGRFVADKSDINAGSITVAASDVTAVNLEVRNGGTLDADSVTNSGTIKVDGSSFTADSVANNGTFTVSGTSKLSLATFSGNAIQVATGATLTNSTVGGNGIVVNGDTSFSGSNTFSNIQFGDGYSTTTDTIAKTVTVSGDLTITGGSTIVGNDNTDAIETLTITGTSADNKASFTTTGSLNVRQSGVVNATYADITFGQTYFMGEVNFTNSTITSTGNSHGIAGRKDKNADGDAIVTLDNSTWVIGNGGHTLEVGGVATGTTIDSDYYGSGALVLKNNSSLDVGQLVILERTSDISPISVSAEDSTIIVRNSLTVGANSTLTVTDSTLSVGTITNNGTITNSGTITFSGDSTLESGVLNGDVTIESGATLTVASSSLLADKGLILENNGTIVYKSIDSAQEIGAGASLSVGVEGSSVTLTAAAGITVNEAKQIDLSTENVDVPAGAVAAWSFNIKNKDDDGVKTEVTVTMDVGTGLDLNTIHIWHKGDKENAEWENYTDVVKNKAYDKASGKLTFTTSSFSTYAAAVPEPSAFGLLAGLGALALVAARRRRR